MALICVFRRVTGSLYGTYMCVQINHSVSLWQGFTKSCIFAFNPGYVASVHPSNYRDFESSYIFLISYVLLNKLI